MIPVVPHDPASTGPTHNPLPIVVVATTPTPNPASAATQPAFICPTAAVVARARAPACVAANQHKPCVAASPVTPIPTSTTTTATAATATAAVSASLLSERMRHDLKLLPASTSTSTKTTTTTTEVATTSPATTTITVINKPSFNPLSQPPLPLPRFTPIPSFQQHHNLLPSSSSVSLFPSFQPFPHPFPSPQPPCPPSAPTAVVWFRADLRVHDHPALCAAATAHAGGHILPVYVFDADEFGRTPFGFEKTGRERATFLLDAVRELREALRARGSDLVIRIGRPATVVASLARAVGASVVYTHQHLALNSTSTSSGKKSRSKSSRDDNNHAQMCNNNDVMMQHNDQQMQMQDEYEEEDDDEEEEDDEQELFKQFDIDLRQLWANTLYDVDDLPFSSLLDLPDVYVTFRQAVQQHRSSVIRPPLSPPDTLPSMPVHVRVLPGDLPTLSTLGFKPLVTTVPSSSHGGEPEGLRRIAQYCDVMIQNRHETSSVTGVQLGADFTCQIAAWLSLGCVSPRKVYDDIKKCGEKQGNKKIALGATYFELLWRDFFRFVTAKYAMHRRKATSIARARRRSRRTGMGKMGVSASSIGRRTTAGAGRLMKHGGGQQQQQAYSHLGTTGGGVAHAQQQRRWNTTSNTNTASAAANAEIRKRAKAAAASVSANATATATATAIATKDVVSVVDDDDEGVDNDVGNENDEKAGPLFVARRRRFSRSLVGGGL